MQWSRCYRDEKKEREATKKEDKIKKLKLEEKDPLEDSTKEKESLGENCDWEKEIKNHREELEEEKIEKEGK